MLALQGNGKSYYILQLVRNQKHKMTKTWKWRKWSEKARIPLGWYVYYILATSLKNKKTKCYQWKKKGIAVKHPSQFFPRFFWRCMKRSSCNYCPLESCYSVTMATVSHSVSCLRRCQVSSATKCRCHPAMGVGTCVLSACSTHYYL